jgi:hypothetical protein
VPVGLALLDDEAGDRTDGRGTQPDVQETGARDLDALDGRVADQLVRDGLRLSRGGQARPAGHLEREIRGVITMAGISGPLDARHGRQHRRIQVPVGQHRRGGRPDRVSKLGGRHAIRC